MLNDQPRTLAGVSGVSGSMSNAADPCSPITSGYESYEVRNSLPWLKAHYYREEQRLRDIETAQVHEPLVYSSISDKQLESPHGKPCIEQAERIDLYSHSARLIRPKLNVPESKTAPDRSGTQIQGFSSKSKSRLRFVAANSADIIKSQFCMTYGEKWPTDGKLSKQHLNKFIKRLRYYFPDLEYIWTLEFQTRYAPHYHFFSSIEHSPENHDLLVKSWYEASGATQDEVMAVHTHASNFIPWDMGNGGYLCKYLDKDNQKIVPEGYCNCGRFWGNSANLKPRKEDEISEDEMKLFSRDPKAWEYLVRNLCKYQESLNPRSTVRRSPQSRTLLTGARIAKQLRDHLLKPPTPRSPQVGGEK